MKETTTKSPFNQEWARQCPFRKEKEITYDLVGPDHTPVPVIEREHFQMCIGEYCIMYMYDKYSDTEYCLLGSKPYEI